MTTRREWAKQLNEMWDNLRRGAVLGFIQIGNKLIECKRELHEQGDGHGKWLKLLENDLKFHRRIAARFMRIAAWSAQIGLNESNLVRLLPPDYNTIGELAQLDNTTFIELVRDGTVSPNLQRNEIRRFRRRQRIHDDEARVLGLVPVVGKFRTLVLDPSWDYDLLSLATRGQPLYAMQSLDSLRELDVMAWAEDKCHLYCWATNNFVIEAGKLVEHWGFQFRTLLTWVKPPPFGLGSYFRHSTEQCLFATLGDTTTRPAGASIATHFEAPRGEHSEKPELFYDIVRAASFPPYGEANQRQERPDFANLFELREAA